MERPNEIYDYPDIPGAMPNGIVIDPNFVGIGFGHEPRNFDDRHSAIAIGFGADADAEGVAIGQNARAGKRAVALGANVVAPDDRLIILRWDLTDVGARLDQLEQMVSAQQKIIADQQEMLEALWYHPGMPGAVEAESSFVVNCANLTSDN